MVPLTYIAYRLLLVAACTLLVTAPIARAQQPSQPPDKVPIVKAPDTAAKIPSKQPTVAESKSVAVWRGQVMAHLNGQKRNFTGGAAGTSTVAFSIDRTGKVLSARLITSSGNVALDREAVTLAQRASPLPVPPESLTGPTLNLTVPIRFKQ